MKSGEHVMAESGLFPDGIQAINVGLAAFAGPPRAHGATVLELDWGPPAEGDRNLGLLVARLEDDPDDPIGAPIARANQSVVDRILRASPALVDVCPASEAIPALKTRMLLHAGPPIDWQRMCGPMRGALIGAILFEGWAGTPEAAAEMDARGEIEFAPCHQYGAVGPMAGVVSPSMPRGGSREHSLRQQGLCHP